MRSITGVMYCFSDYGTTNEINGPGQPADNAARVEGCWMSDRQRNHFSRQNNTFFPFRTA